jgi:hypothetical protein
VHVMQILRAIVPHLCLFGEPGAERFCPPWASFASTWPQVVDWIACSPQPNCPTRASTGNPQPCKPPPVPRRGGDRSGKDDEDLTVLPSGPSALMLPRAAVMGFYAGPPNN